MRKRGVTRRYSKMTIAIVCIEPNIPSLHFEEDRFKVRSFIRARKSNNRYPYGDEAEEWWFNLAKRLKRGLFFFFFFSFSTKPWPIYSLDKASRNACYRSNRIIFYPRNTAFYEDTWFRLVLGDWEEFVWF